jgi:hypothetical protein
MQMKSMKIYIATTEQSTELKPNGQKTLSTQKDIQYISHEHVGQQTVIVTVGTRFKKQFGKTKASDK